METLNAPRGNKKQLESQNPPAVNAQPKKKRRKSIKKNKAAPPVEAPQTTQIPTQTPQQTDSP